MNNLNSISWHFIKIDSFQDPSNSPYGSDSKHIKIDSFQDPVQWDIWQNVRNWLLSRPLYFTPKLAHFKTLCSELYIKSSKMTPFKTITLDYIVFSISMGDYLQIDSVKISMGDYFQNYFFQDHPYTVELWLLSSPFRGQHIICGELTHFKTIWKRNGTIEHITGQFSWFWLLSRPQYIGSYSVLHYMQWHLSNWLISRPQDLAFCTICSDIHQKWLISRPHTGQGHSYSSSHSNVHTH